MALQEKLTLLGDRKGMSKLRMFPSHTGIPKVDLEGKLHMGLTKEINGFSQGQALLPPDPRFPLMFPNPSHSSPISITIVGFLEEILRGKALITAEQ